MKIYEMLKKRFKDTEAFLHCSNFELITLQSNVFKFAKSPLYVA